MRSFMRWIIVVVLGLTVAACGGSGGNKSSGDAAPSSSQLHARLLNADDVGASWKVGHSINAEDLAAFAQAPCESATISPALVKRLTAVTGTQFEPVDRAYRHLIELVVTGDPKQLDNDLQSVFTAIESCPSGGAAAGSAVAVTKLSIPKLGDQQAAYAVTQKSQGSSATALLLRAGYVRLGSVAVVVGLTDFQASSEGISQIGDDTFRALVTKATTKLRSTI